ATLLRNVARRQPLVLILEDLHAADDASVLLLEFLASEIRGSRLLVLGTYRDVALTPTNPLTRLLAELARANGTERFVLVGLQEEEVARFLEITAGFMPPRSLVSAVHRETAGNPLFVTEVVRLLAMEGKLTRAETHDGGVNLAIPRGAREVIRH